MNAYERKDDTKYSLNDDYNTNPFESMFLRFSHYERNSYSFIIITIFNKNFHLGKKLNGIRLLEFSTTTDERTTNQELRVRIATLWIRVDLKLSTNLATSSNTNITLWIFRLLKPIGQNNSNYIDDKVIRFSY